MNGTRKNRPILLIYQPPVARFFASLPAKIRQEIVSKQLLNNFIATLC
ncbi:MAG: hypothetical protein V4709_12920 [Pseudomonadota bacterium]